MGAEIFFKQIKAHYDKNLPFVCVGQNRRLKAYLQEDSVLYNLDDFSLSGFVFCPFSSSEVSVYFPQSKLKRLDSELLHKPTRKCVNSIKIESKNQNQHIDLIKKAIQHIKEGHTSKIVCSRKVNVEIEIDVLKVFQALCHNYSNAYCYCWFHPKVGLWIGATPEQFININRDNLHTVALAGTINAIEYPTPLWSAKEKEEQQMVTDFIVEVLQKYSKHIDVGHVETIRAGNLWHLKTHISANINSLKLSEIIRELHPTSAVCGLPKEKARSFILEYENYNRKYYSGFLGELNFKSERSRNKHSKNQEQLAVKFVKKHTDLYVNLRCMQVFGDRIEVYVGGGITKDSDPEAEFLETQAKSQTLLNVL